MPTATETGYERKTGLLPTLKRTLKEFSQDNLTDWAAALTYYGVLAMFPALIALVSIVGLVFEPREVTRTLTDTITAVSPGSSAEALKGPIESVTSSPGKSGVFLIIGILAALWSASGYVGAFMRASNIMFEVDEGRPIWKLRPLQMLVTLVMILLIALTGVAVVVSGPLAQALGESMGIGDTAITIFNYAKWPIIVGVVMLMLAILYYSAPNAKVRGFKFISPGSIIAVIVWIVASALFAFYVSNFGSYDKTYGSLAGVILFLVWLWISNVAVLLGMQINAERERDMQIKEGVPGAERELRLTERDEAPEKKRPTTA
jgi:membrane protein